MRRRPGTVLRRMIPMLAFVSVGVSSDAQAQARWATLDEFLTGGIRLNAQEMAALKRGDVIARMLPTGDQRDIAVFGGVQIDVPRSFYIDREREFPRALRTPTRTQVQMFSEPATTTDVQSLDVAADDLKELRSCRPNKCNFKLPGTDMERLRTTVDWSAPNARSQVATYARQRIVEYVNDYRSRGNAAMAVYDDRGTVQASDALAAMLRDSSYVFSAVPSLGQLLLEYPRSAPPNATDVIFWSRDELPHLRRVLRITHETIYSPSELPQMTLVAAKQIYADHYFEAGLEVLAAVDRVVTSSSPGNAITLVAVRRYRFDHLPSGGLLNIRGRVGNGLRDNVLADLKRVKRDTEAAWAQRAR